MFYTTGSGKCVTPSSLWLVTYSIPIMFNWIFPNWYNLDMTWQPFIPKRLSVTTAGGTIAVMRTSRVRKAIWDQSAETTTRVVAVCIY